MNRNLLTLACLASMISVFLLSCGVAPQKSRSANTTPVARDFVADFDNGYWDISDWEDIGKYNRKLHNGRLEYRISTTNEVANSFIEFAGANPSDTQGSISGELTLDSFSQTGDSVPVAWIHGFFYHTNTPGEAPGNRIGDVVAQVNLTSTDVNYQVFRCLTSECDKAEDMDFLTPIAGVSFGNVAIGDTVTLLLDWNNLHKNKFTFQLNSNTPVTFDPVAAGSPIDGATANSPGKWIGVRIISVDTGESADLAASFDNITLNGTPYDNFNTGTYLNGTLWRHPSGYRTVDAGKLILATGVEYSGDPTTDDTFHNNGLYSQPYPRLNAESAEADIAINNPTLLDQAGGDETEVRAMLEMHFQPRGALNSQDLFGVQAVLEAHSSTLSAKLVAFGCANTNCTNMYPISNQVQNFASPIILGTMYNFKIEHVGGGVVSVTIDDKETLMIDLSTVPEFASATFKQVGLRTRARQTDFPGEQALIVASFDNVRVGLP